MHNYSMEEQYNICLCTGRSCILFEMGLYHEAESRIFNAFQMNFNTKV